MSVKLKPPAGGETECSRLRHPVRRTGFRNKVSVSSSALSQNSCLHIRNRARKRTNVSVFYVTQLYKSYPLPALPYSPALPSCLTVSRAILKLTLQRAGITGWLCRKGLFIYLLTSALSICSTLCVLFIQVLCH